MFCRRLRRLDQPGLSLHGLNARAFMLRPASRAVEKELILMPDSADEYIASLPDDRREPATRLRAAINKNLPQGFEETFAGGMINWAVPHRTYPAG